MNEINLTIVLDFGDGFIEELTIEEARELKDKLNSMFGRDAYIPWFPEIPKPDPPLWTSRDTSTNIFIKKLQDDEV